MYYVFFYVPEDYADKVKEAMFAVGAGALGNYTCCSFESEGIGQFKPMTGSLPFLGSIGEIEKVKEIKVEMICQESALIEAVSALKQTHPYETPAYYVIKTVEI